MCVAPHLGLAPWLVQRFCGSTRAPVPHNSLGLVFLPNKKRKTKWLESVSATTAVAHGVELSDAVVDLAKGLEYRQLRIRSHLEGSYRGACDAGRTY